MEIATPRYSHVKNYENVYEPAEDTFLLLDSLQSEQTFIKNLRPLFILEIGCGSGIVTSFIQKIVGSSAAYICTDKNHEASLCCNETAEHNELAIENISTDLVSGLLPRMKQKIDILLFNPPYVVTPTQDVDENGLSSSWAGGVDGREVMDRVFPVVPLLLSKKGLFYLVVIEENKPKEIMEAFHQMEFESSIVLSRRSGPELLSVVKFWRR